MQLKRQSQKLVRTRTSALREMPSEATGNDKLGLLGSIKYPRQSREGDLAAPLDAARSLADRIDEWGTVVEYPRDQS